MTWFNSVFFLHLVLAAIGIVNGILGIAVLAVRFISHRKFRPGRMAFDFGLFEFKTASAGFMVAALGIVLLMDAGAVASEFYELHQTETRAEDDAGKLTSAVESMRSSSVPMTKIAQLVRDKFLGAYSLEAVPMKAKSFQTVETLVGLLSTDGSPNGHALYFEGEVKRAEEQCSHAREAFISYIEIAHRRESEMGTSTDRDYCYQLPHGYCRQRAGWIEYLLSIGYYAQALHSTDADAKISLINEASAHLHESYRWFSPHKFNTLIESKKLEDSFKIVIDAAIHHRRPVGAAVWKPKC